MIYEKLPSEIIIDSIPYPIHTDFRNWIKFDIEMSDNALSETEKLYKGLVLCYKELPSSLDKAVTEMFNFFIGKNKDKKQGESNEKQKRIYSFEHDEEYIYSAFLGQYNIDLSSINLHWWQFKALFKALDENCMMSKIMQYRSIDLATIKDKEQKKFYRKMQNIYKLPDNRTAEEKEKDMIDSLSELF